MERTFSETVEWLREIQNKLEKIRSGNSDVLDEEVAIENYQWLYSNKFSELLMDENIYYVTPSDNYDYFTESENFEGYANVDENGNIVYAMVKYKEDKEIKKSFINDWFTDKLNGMEKS